MTSVAVVAHRRKDLAGGLPELRRLLAERGVDTPLWYEVKSSRRAGREARRAVEQGADLLFAWGGDGTVQRCIDAVAGTGVDLAIVPAGTANLLASNLGIPKDLGAAVVTGLYGVRRPIDVGRVNGERFAVMAGAGFDALMTADADRRLKKRVGQLAYIWTGARATRLPARRTRIDVDKQPWFDGKASCVLLGNVGTVAGGITAFEDAHPDDGRLDVGVVTADGMVQWARVLGRLVAGRAERSPLVRTTTGRRIDVRFDTATVYELDGGARAPVKKLKVRIEPAALRVCVPIDEEAVAS
jgi:YegS/Rv2252/BmrU family lipid kinase